MVYENFNKFFNSQKGQEMIFDVGDQIRKYVLHYINIL